MTGIRKEIKLWFLCYALKDVHEEMPIKMDHNVYMPRGICVSAVDFIEKLMSALMDMEKVKTAPVVIIRSRVKIKTIHINLSWKDSSYD